MVTKKTARKHVRRTAVGGGAANMVAAMPYYAASGVMGGGGAKAKHPKVKSIFLVIREWHRRSYGGMFATAEIHINGAFVTKLDETGGGASMAEQNATEWLVENGYIKATRGPGGYPPLFRLAMEHKFKVENSVTEVAREKDL